MNHEHKSVQANNMTYILDEQMAFKLLHAMREEFNWAGTMFCKTDVADTIEDRRAADDLEPLPEAQLTDATNKIMQSYGWGEITSWLAEKGSEYLDYIIEEKLEYPASHFLD